MFLMIDTVNTASCADDNNPYSEEKKQMRTTKKLQNTSVKWFLNGSMKNGMKAN